MATGWFNRSGVPKLYKPEEVQKNAAVFLGSLEKFVVAASPKTDPTPFERNWHVVAIRDKLEASH
jgi:hypothetical protein